ncbi:MAG: cytochrome c biogenesis protein CcsA [Bdellovibrionales bacterium]|nr:cytochrome c biogenesis protein CcsA [Bdellovibrionales bacterium]
MKIRNALLGLIFVSSWASASDLALPEIPKKKWDFSEFAQTPTHVGGRLKPLDTFAREVVLQLTSSRSYKGWDPVDFVLSLAAHPADWETMPIISVSLLDVKRQLGLEEKRSHFSAVELIRDSYLGQYAQRLGSDSKSMVPNLSGGVAKADPREQEIKKILERLLLFRSLANGDAWTLIPATGGHPWSPLSDKNQKGPEATEIRAHFAGMLQAYRNEDEKTFRGGSLHVRQAVLKAMKLEDPKSMTEDLKREVKTLGSEVFYNRLHPFMWGWILYLLGAILWIFVLVQNPKAKAVFNTLALSATGMGLLAHITGITLRCYIAGRPPVSNMYESIVWVALGVMAFGAIIYATQRQAVLLAVSCVLACFGLIAADAAPAMMDPGIHPLVPVLRSNYWLTIHVLTITLGYAAFALSLGISNVTLWNFLKKANASKIAGLNQLSYRAMQFGVVLLAAGTILGGIWADASWGRFWGWDPKEVWALIALLGYIAILHARYVGWIQQFGFAASSVVSFMLVVMAWYGVNFVLGEGKHSYGFASGGRGPVFTVCGLQLLFVLWVAARQQGWLKKVRL